MKKLFATTIDISAQDKETICFSAGKIGYQVEVSPKDLAGIYSPTMTFLFLDIVKN